MFYLLPWAVITEYPKLNSRNLLSHSPEAGNLRSRCQQGWVLRSLRESLFLTSLASSEKMKNESHSLSPTTSPRDSLFKSLLWIVPDVFYLYKLLCVYVTVIVFHNGIIIVLSCYLLSFA